MASPTHLPYPIKSAVLRWRQVFRDSTCAFNEIHARDNLSSHFCQWSTTKKLFTRHGTVETGHQDWSKWLLFFISIFRIGQNEWLQIPLFWTSLLCTPLLIILIKLTWWLAWLVELKDKANHKFKLNKMHSHLAKKSPFSSIRYFVE